MNATERLTMKNQLNGHKQYLLASDFDQTLSFNDSGQVLAEILGISNFQQKVAGLTRSNLLHQGAELAYLLLHDPEFKAKVRKEHLREATALAPLSCLRAAEAPPRQARAV